MSTTEAALDRVVRTRERVDKFRKWRAEREPRAYADEQVEEAERRRDQASRHADGCRRIAERNDGAFASLGEQRLSRTRARTLASNPERAPRSALP